MSKICMMLSAAANPLPNDGVLGVGFADGVFTPVECQQIVQLSQRQVMPDVQGGFGAWQNPGLTLKNSTVATLAPDASNRWVYEKMDAAVGSANKGYQFDLAGFEPFQVETYNADGYHDWHMDLGKGPASTRKISVMVQLSDGGDYEGGNMEFRGGGAPPLAPREIGTLVVFPAFMQHRIAPVTAGTRKALLAWIHGNAFR